MMRHLKTLVVANICPIMRYVENLSSEKEFVCPIRQIIDSLEDFYFSHGNE